MKNDGGRTKAVGVTKKAETETKRTPCGWAHGNPPYADEEPDPVEARSVNVVVDFAPDDDDDLLRS